MKFNQSMISIQKLCEQQATRSAPELGSQAWVSIPAYGLAYDQQLTMLQAISTLTVSVGLPI